MADNERKKKKRKKNIKKSSGEEQDSSAFTSPDTNASQNEKTATSDKSPAALKESKSSPQKLAPKLPSSNRNVWSLHQEETLLKNVKKYSSMLSGNKQYWQRVDWPHVEKVDDFTLFEMEEKYKALTKKVRKTRSVHEIVDDALLLLKEPKQSPAVPVRKVKKVKKQAPNAFSIFCKAKRPGLVEKHPELQFGAIHKKLCERWKELSADKREKYVSKAEKAKEEFYAEIQKLQEQELSRIKKPMSAYNLWKSERMEDEDVDGDWSESELQLEWENLPKSTKKGWQQAAASEKEKYDLEVSNVTGSSGSKMVKKVGNDKRSVVETKTKDESGSDEEEQQSSPPPENSASKRKLNSPGKSTKSPVKKMVKKEKSSSSESSESHPKRKLNSPGKSTKSPVKKMVKKEKSSSSESSESHSSSDED